MIMQSVVLLRQTEDWLSWKNRSLEYEERLTNCGLYDAGNRTKFFISNLRHWNQSLSSDYFDYRHSLKQVAQGFLKCTKCKIVDSLSGLPKNTCVFPIDDDDWFREDISSRVTPIFEANPHIRVVVWNSWIFTPCSPDPFLQLTGETGDNAYACFAEDGRYLHAHNLLWNELVKDKHPSVYRLNDDLSVWIRHPAAYMRMSNPHMPNWGDGCLSFPNEIPEVLRWAEPAIRRVWRITSRLFRHIKCL